jgi:L-lysine exporter family protein LysE/ArgO
MAASLLLPFGQGLFLAAGLIIAIGAQNAFVLRQGLLRQHVLLVVTICWVSDALLIIFGVTGMSHLLTNFTAFIPITRFLGALFLAAYGLFALRRCLYPQPPPAIDASLPARAQSRRRICAICLAFTYLNPHVYLDTVILLGSLASPYPLPQKMAFTLGACSASFLWFHSLGFGARLLIPFFTKALAWQILDGLIALVMLALSLSLIASIF